MDDLDGVNSFLDSLEIAAPGEEFIGDPAWIQSALTPSQREQQIRRIERMGEIIGNWRRRERHRLLILSFPMDRERGP